MDDYDVIYLDDDERNPRASVIDSRGRPIGRPGMVRPRPGGSSVVVPPSRRPTVIHSGGSQGSQAVDRRPTVIYSQPAHDNKPGGPGNQRSKRVPSPGVLETWMSPCRRRMTLWTTDSPRPVP